MKKMRWLWSYRIDSTEIWLEDLVAKGFHLKSLNRFSSVFTFEQGDSIKKKVRIHYGEKTLAPKLASAGWESAVISDKWQVLTNENQQISIYPSKDQLFKRTRLHAYMYILISTFYLSFYLSFLFIFGIILNIFSETLQIAPLIVPIIIYTGLIALTIFVFKAYRKFEKQFLGTDVIKKSGTKKIRRIRPGWMYEPLRTTVWLEEMAQRGYELESVFATIFTFRPKGKNNIAYEVAFEPKINANYFQLHKDFGWELKYTSNITWLNYTIWGMPYEEEEVKPAFSYDELERRKVAKKAFLMNCGMSVFILFICAQSIYMNTVTIDRPFLDWSYMGVIRIMLVVMSVFWLFMFVRIVLGYRKELQLISS
ncbi:DUF2812 domain-containing protein [Psychrobacillus sp. INOP01]|uniref:DUF2812 domain-containing protein n=1 Tax=Psychrobacillus sp. INOP01 TaxID=2829187 RepID=UPI001BABDA29|nr:DUF2812 domain-containing protein [Psychrobacillus sp. INOP01]QUG40266.1 DUF2812 domain-containing protein [Psychrobacillus sp. INOP01]